MVVEKLEKSIRNALLAWGLLAEDVEKINISFEHPADLSNGDYSTNIAFSLLRGIAKQTGTHVGESLRWVRVDGLQRSTSPRRVGEEILKLLQKPKEVERVEVAPAGFINFYLSKEFFAEAIKGVDEDFGKNTILAGKKVMVEYTDPNPFKEFHIGHLMSNAIGESVARIFEYHGAKVVRACWQGDIGLHVAKAVWGTMKIKNQKSKIKIEDLGKAYAMGSEAYETDEMAKQEINELNKKIFERTDRAVNELYNQGREVSLAHFEEIYKVLGTRFDHHFFESKEGVEGKPIVEECLKKGVFERSEGAVIYKGEKQGLHTRVFLTKEGLPTYEAKELGLNKAKFEKEPDIETSIIVTANEQSDYFKVVLAAMKEVLPEIAKKTRHIAHGMLRFASGKMSSRKGNVITGESLIEQVKEMVREKIKEREMPEAEKEEVAEIVAVGAIKYSILRQAVGGDIVFDFEKSISFEGDSGPYLQYSYVRAKSVLAKAEREHLPLTSKTRLSPSTEVETKREVTMLERLLYRFPEVVEHAGAEYQPHYITTYLTELAGAFNGWYAREQIVDATDPSSPYKVALTEAFASVMQNGLWLLGIKVPRHM